MAKLTATQKSEFKFNVEMLNKRFGVNNWACRYSKEEGVTILAFYIGPMQNHFKVIATYCGYNDTFKKKIGLNECVKKMQNCEGLLVKSSNSYISYELADYIDGMFVGVEFEYLN